MLVSKTNYYVPYLDAVSISRKVIVLYKFYPSKGEFHTNSQDQKTCLTAGLNGSKS